MRAMVMDAVGKPLEVREVAEPVAPAGGVVVTVRATGLCRSDWHAWVGHEQLELPHIPGHELAGVVEAVGEGVTAWRVGDRVTVPFVCGCGQCEWCLRGDAQVCPHQEQPGFTHHGSFAERVALHAADTNLVRIPDSVSFEAAAALGCRFATAFRAVHVRARLLPGEWLAVFGAGGVGLSAIMIARALGARVVAVDRNPGALEAAAALGAEHTVLAGGREASDGIPVADRVHELTDGGAHVSVDAVGSEQTSSDSILSLRRRGRHVQVGLLPSESGLTAIPMARAISWELDILGSHGMAAVDYPAMLALIERGALRPQDLITSTISLEEGAERLTVLDRSTAVGITMIDPTAQ